MYCLLRTCSYRKQQQHRDSGSFLLWTYTFLMKSSTSNCKPSPSGFWICWMKFAGNLQLCTTLCVLAAVSVQIIEYMTSTSMYHEAVVSFYMLGHMKWCSRAVHFPVMTTQWRQRDERMSWRDCNLIWSHQWKNPENVRTGWTAWVQKVKSY